MRRLFLQTAAASLLTAAFIVTAHAHASLEKSEAAPGSYKAVLKIPHGCDGKATNLVRIDIPEGYIGVKPMPKAGWTLETKKGDYAKKYDLHGEEATSGVTSVTWSGGFLPDEFYDEFVLSGTLAGVEAGQKLFFKAVQQCGNAEVAWNEEPAEGQDPHALEHPAPSLTILAAGADEHAGHGMAMSTASEAVTAGDITVGGGWARAMLPGQPAGGGYLTITNKGQMADKLGAASSPNAGKVEIHTMEVVNDVMVMRPVEGGLEIPAGATVELKPGGLHVMFMQVNQPFKVGGTVPVTLQFEKAGKVEVMLPVQAKGAPEDHSKHGMLPDSQMIEHVMKATWDKPDAPLNIQPIVIEGDYAVAGWSQEGKGGRALLKKADGAWAIHLCTGDAVKEPLNLQQMGVPATTSNALASALASAEAKMDSQTLALFSTFDGVVMMGAEGHAPVTGQ